MNQEITPIPVRPWTLNGLSERLIVSHYENIYGAAVRALNAVRAELADARSGDTGLPAPRPEARRADRHGLRHAPRAVLREPGW